MALPRSTLGGGWGEHVTPMLRAPILRSVGANLDPRLRAYVGTDEQPPQPADQGRQAHHMADPALAARLVGLNAAALIGGEGPRVVPRVGTFLGALFESLATLNVRVFAPAAEASIFHVRNQTGRQEIDLVVERGDRRVVACEVKLTETWRMQMSPTSSGSGTSWVKSCWTPWC